MTGNRAKCYPADRKAALRIAGSVLLAAGGILLFVCIPCWAWLALLGTAAIALGLLLLKISNAWR